jgi:acetolactate synthase-1/2/3 large subunit
LNIYDELLEQADLVLVVGSRLENVSDFYLGSRMPKQMIQIDIDARVLGRRRQIDVGLLGDAGVILSNLKEALVETKHHSCWFDTHGFRQRKHLKLQERAAPILDLILELRNSVPDNTIFVDDLTLVGYWMPILMPTYQPRTLIDQGGVWLIEIELKIEGPAKRVPWMP